MAKVSLKDETIQFWKPNIYAHMRQYVGCKKVQVL